MNQGTQKGTKSATSASQQTLSAGHDEDLGIRQLVDVVASGMRLQGIKYQPFSKHRSQMVSGSPSTSRPRMPS